MPESQQINASITSVPKPALIALAVIFVAGLFAVAFDHGHILSLVYGEQAFIDPYLHELTHDTTHAAGFPCH